MITILVCPVISPSSDSDDKESESDSDSGYEDEHSKEDGHDHRVNDITHNKEEIYCMEKDHYKICFKGCFLPRFAQFYKQSQTKPTENMIQIMTLDWMCYALKKSKITRGI